MMYQGTQRWLLAALGLLAGLVLTHRWWLSPIGGYLIVADPLEPADALVALAGDRYRVDEAARLFHAGYTQWLAITDMWLPCAEGRCPPGEYAAQIRRQLLGNGVPEARVVTARDVAATTYEEAYVLRQMADAHEWRSLIVVTSPYHTRRSQMILAEAFAGSGVRVAVRPVEGHCFIRDGWWRCAGGARIALTEYAKLVLYKLGYHRLADVRSSAHGTASD